MTVVLGGDKALVGTEGDRLGFAATAQAIAAAILRQPSVDGLVVGIEGRWGSGKSSLVNMTTAALRSDGAEKAPEIIEFKPWLIGDRDSLLLALFTELAIAVDAIEESMGDATGRKRRELGQTGKQILDFAAGLGSVSALAKVAGAFVPGMALAGEAIEAGANAAKAWSNRERSLATEKAELRERLAALQRRIVITVDDVDRLEPGEVVEILRLVRSVADFPNVVYVLCYDPDIVAHSIQAAAQVENGRAYIEKIVQITVPVPRPEAFDLRHWFRDEVNTLPNDFDEADDSKSRLRMVIDVEGGRYLSTPRHVVRCLDGVKFFWNALQGQADLADLIWLHLVKIGNIDLYNWIEQYLPEMAAQTSGLVFISETDKSNSRKNLDNALLKEGAAFDDARYRLRDFLPGVDSGINFDKKEKPGIFSPMSTNELALSARFLRLSSPDHYRLYFAMQQPINSPRREDFEEFFSALDASTSDSSRLLARWSSERLSTGATKAEVVLSRIVDTDAAAFSPNRAQALIYTMADQMDEMAKVREERLGDPISWTEGDRIFRMLLQKIEGRREDTLLSMFRGQALGWLTALLRDETFAHGRVDDRPRGKKLLTSEELDLISEAMIERYRSLYFDDWKKLRDPVSALFAWYQAGDKVGPRDMLASVATTDDGFLSVLELMGTRVISSSRGSFVSMKKTTIDYFMDYEEARSRVETLSENSDDIELRKRAVRLKEYFSESEYH